MAKDKKEGVTIVIKKVQGGHGGGHGGAWKVAYADFVTAMMAFFLVLWLTSADEETKSIVSHYFNHPNTPYNKGRDEKTTEAVPLGERVGQGESMNKGAEGAVPEDLVQTPMKDLKDEVQTKLGDITFGLELDSDVDVLKFSIPGDELFVEGGIELRKDAFKRLEQLAKIFAKVQGNILIEGHLDKKPPMSGEDPYLFSTERAISVMNFFVKQQHMDENRFCPRGIASRRAWSTNGRGIAADDSRNRRVEFTVSPKNICSQE